MELDSCPFCGGDATLDDDGARRGTRTRSCIVVCTRCGATQESNDEGDRSGESWNRRAYLKASSPRTAATPDFVYDPDDWEATYPWEMRSDVAEDDPAMRDPGSVKRYETLAKGAPLFAARVSLTFDVDGCPDETEIRWFDSEQEASAAAAPVGTIALAEQGERSEGEAHKEAS